MTDMYTLQDPTEQYPLPPFKRQTQKAPGMAKKMVPKPDHGELRYGGWTIACAKGAGYWWRFGDWAGDGDCVSARRKQM